jgi:hypothetical protein
VPFFNAAAQASFQITTGSAQISVRSNGPLNYTAGLDANGVVTLSRAGAPAQIAVTTPGTPGQWRTLRISAVNNVVRVNVDGAEVIVWVDDAPLPPGGVTISANFPPDADPNNPTVDTLQADDFALFVPAAEVAMYPTPTPAPTETPVVEVTEEPTLEVTPDVTIEATEEPIIEATDEARQAPGNLVIAVVPAPELKTPADLSFVNTPRPTLTWKAVTNADRYRVQIDNNSDFSSPLFAGSGRVVTTTNLALTSTVLPVALTQTKYYWKVQAHDASGWSGDSDVWEFTVDLATTPANDAVITGANTVRPTFTWAGASLAGATYVVQIDDAPDFAAPLVHESTPRTGTTYQVPAGAALGHGIYYWRVVVNGEDIDEALNIYNRFTVSPAIPAPALTAPANNLLTTDQTLLFDWNDVAVGTFTIVYDIQIDKQNTFANPRTVDQANLPDSQFDYTGTALPDGKYYWRVRAVIDELDTSSAWSAVRNFTIDTTAVPKKPLNGAFTTDRTPTFEWNSVPGANQYCLMLADNELMTGATAIFTGNALTYTPTNANRLDYDNYWWRVDAGAGSCSQAPTPVIFALTVTPPKLAAPTLTSPGNAKTLFDSTPPLSWTAVVDPNAQPVTYQIQVATNSTFSNIVFTFEDTDTSQDVAPALTDRKYYWRVRALNYLGYPSAWSSVRNFRIRGLPTAPAFTVPICGAAKVGAKPKLEWSATAGAVSYQVQLDTHNPPTSLIVSTGANLFYTPPAPLLYTTYYRRVRGVDSLGNVTPWSTEPCTLIVQSPAGIAPIPNRFTSATPTLTWTPISWATGYELQIYNSMTFNANTRVYTRNNIDDDATSHTVEISLADGTYYWRIRALGGGNVWSSTGTFQIDTVP